MQHPDVNAEKSLNLTERQARFVVWVVAVAYFALFGLILYLTRSPSGANRQQESVIIRE